MSKIGTLLISGLVTASLTVGLVVPATAADTKGTLAIVNGIPGQKVDVCLNGKEIKSKLKYGGVVLKGVVPTGTKNLRFYKPDRRTCRGTLLANKQFPLAAADDLTIVVTKLAPKIVMFSNALLGEIPPLGTATPYAPFAFRHAAEVVADLSYRYWSVPGTVPINPSGLFTKGQQNRTTDASSGGFNVGFLVQVRATVIGDPVPIASPIVETIQSHRLEWILVGTKHDNARWVFIDRLVSKPTPAN